MNDISDNICKDGRPIVGSALIMIPDISGFTRLVHESEILNCYKQSDIQNYIDCAHFDKGSATYRYIGKVSYRYVSLKPLFTTFSNLKPLK